MTLGGRARIGASLSDSKACTNHDTLVYCLPVLIGVYTRKVRRPDGQFGGILRSFP